jgi:1-acyl-sn-glycerol-3-phosphate acyltransferase
MNWLRTLAFRLIFYAGSVPIVLAVPLVALFGQRAMIPHSHGWAWFHRWVARTILGVETRVEGEIPAGQVLFAAKHQAMYETLELQLILGGPAMVLKQELMRIPFWGWATVVYGAIVVDRDASAKALRKLVRDASAAKATGRSVIVYPEGTRVAPGEAPPLRSGFAGLYKTLDLPVVPIALDSGLLMPRHGTKRPGIVTVRIGTPVPPGLPRREAERQVWAAINALEPAAIAGPTPST